MWVLCVCFMKIKLPVFLLIILLSSISCRREIEDPIVVDFSYEVELEAYPEHHAAAVNFTNTSTGAYKYVWTFENGTPAKSDKAQPGTVTYTRSGTFKVTLEAWNYKGEKNVKSIDLTVDTALFLAFDIDVMIDNSSPVEINIRNKTIGAVSYQWTFEGGIPSSSNEVSPQNIVFNEVGSHAITLVASDGNRELSLQKNIEVTPPLTIDFDIVLPFGEDTELPLSASLVNKSTCYNRIQWSADNGAIIANPTGESTTIQFVTSGINNITLKAMSAKDTLILRKSIEVKADKNLVSLSNIQLGIVTASNTVSPFYSTALRRNISPTEAQTNAGKEIDIVFSGHSRLFTVNKFITPDSVSSSLLPHYQNSMKTWIINDLNSAAISFSESNFNNLSEGSQLEQYNIKALCNWNDFTLQTLPYFVLYETADGRKGVIKIKQTMDNGGNSYIIADVKVQKHKQN